MCQLSRSSAWFATGATGWEIEQGRLRRLEPHLNYLPGRGNPARWLLSARDSAPGHELVLTHEFFAIMRSVRRAVITLVGEFFETAGFIRTGRGDNHPPSSRAGEVCLYMQQALAQFRQSRLASAVTHPLPTDVFKQTASPRYRVQDGCHHITTIRCERETVGQYRLPAVSSLQTSGKFLLELLPAP